MKQAINSFSNLKRTNLYNIEVHSPYKSDHPKYYLIWRHLNNTRFYLIYEAINFSQTMVIMYILEFIQFVQQKLVNPL